MSNWKDLYTEISEKIIENSPEIKWVDLWHNQVNFMAEEHPFHTPAVFLDFRILNVSGLGGNHQQLEVQVGMYLFYETFLDTFDGAYNQEDALDYLALLSELQACFHDSNGCHYDEMTRTGLQPIDTGAAGNLYLITFSCGLIDTAAEAVEDAAIPNNVEVDHA